MSADGSAIRTASLTVFAGLILFAILASATLLPMPTAFSAGPASWMISAIAVSGVIGAVLAWRGAPKAAWLASLLILSGASQLWLSDAGWFKTFEIRNLGRLDQLAYGIILLQGLVSLMILLVDPNRWLLRSLGSLTLGRLVRLGLLFGALALFSVSIMSFVGRYDRLGYMLQLVIGSAAMAASVAGVVALLFASDLERVSVPEAMVRTVQRHAYLLIPVAFLFIAALYATLAFGNVPVVEDETAYLFQAKTLAGGAFHAPELPAGIAERLEFYLISNDADGWYATTVPGWPLVLAFGVWIGLPWLVNPVLGAASVWLGMSFWRQVTDREQGLIVGLLMLASPWLLQASASLMTHPLVLALTLGAWCLTSMARTRAATDWRTVSALVFMAGLMMGWIFLTRAVEGVLIGGLTGFWILWYFGRQFRVLPVLAYGMGCLATGSLYFLYNLHMTGDPLLTPLMVYVNAFWGDGANAFGFGPEIGPPGGWGLLDIWPGHSPPEAVINLNNSVNALNTELFGWTIGSLSLLLIYLIWRRPSGVHLAMLCLAGLVILVHAFYWFTGTFYIGPRYWFGAFFAFIALSAGGIDVLRDYVRSDGRPNPDGRLNLVVLLLCGFSIIVFSSWRGSERFHPRTHDARVMAQYQTPDEVAANAIIILPCKTLFEGAMHRNDPFLRETRPIFVMADETGAVSDLEAAFPNREIVYAAALETECRD
jgi:hypothetical protein